LRRHGNWTASAPAAAPDDEPLEPERANGRSLEENKEDWVPKRKRGLFRRAAEEDYFEEDHPAAFAPEPAEAPRSRGRKKTLDDDLDIDLDE
jgi:hypothetical protein